MKYYRVSEAVFVRAKSKKDAQRVLDIHNVYGVSDMSEVRASDVHHKNGYIKLYAVYADHYDGLPCARIYFDPHSSCHV